MGIAIVIVATVPAYLAGALALLFGAGWLLSLAVVSGTGVLSVCAIGCGVAYRSLGSGAQADPETA